MTDTFIGGSLLLLAGLYFIFNIVFKTYLYSNKQPEYVGADVIVRNLNLNILSDIKLDIYYRFLYKDLKRLFKYSEVYKVDDRRILIIYNNTEINFDTHDDTIWFEHIGLSNNLVAWSKFLRKYNLEPDIDDKILAKWYIKNKLL